jgi:hypothetical protein
MDIAIRWALRWLSRHAGASRPDDRTIERLYDQLVSAFLKSESYLHCNWVQHNTLKKPKWRQDIRSLRRNPNRLRCFASKEHLAQILLYGAARAGATDDMETLLVEMEADQDFFERIISLALQEDRLERSERLLHEPGGRPQVYWCYFPLVEAAADVFHTVMARRLKRSTTSETKSDTRDAGKATGPGVEFLKRLLAAFPEPFTKERIARLIREALKAS